MRTEALILISLLSAAGCATPASKTARLASYQARKAVTAAPTTPAAGAAANPTAPAAAAERAPLARRSDHVDELHGVRVEDPYRWLEELDSPETRAFIEAENAVSQRHLAAIPERDAIRARLTALYDYEKFSAPVKAGGRYFYLRNEGLQNQAPLYVADGLDAAPRKLLDPNELAKDGTVALAGYFPSEDGRLLAYALAAAGSDWREFRVRDVDSGRDLDDRIQWTKFGSVSWLKDGSGFFYGAYPAPADPSKSLAAANYDHKLFLHKLGTPQSEDRLVCARPDQKEWRFGGQVTEDGRWLVIYVSRSSAAKNQIWLADLGDGGVPGPIFELFPDFDTRWWFTGNDGPVFYFVTDKDAPRGRVVAIDVAAARAAPATPVFDLIPEAEEVLEDASFVGGLFAISYSKDARSLVRVFDRDGNHVRDVALPGLGTASGFEGRHDDPETFFSFTSFTTPATIFRHDLATGETALFRRPAVDFDGERFETRQVFFASKDGTKVPLFVTARKGIALDGRNPTYLTGYGGFRRSLTPWFGVGSAVWLEMGGVLAVPNLRGGGEYGEAWHEAGMRDRKQNVFDDFIAAAEWLVANRYTSPDRLAIGGGSNGGLLVGACLAQRPELFGAALPSVGVMDMLRYHKFTIGWAWAEEYGTADDPAQFRTLLAYSPCHNLKPGKAYPPTLVTTADHDDRVVPAHSYKFAAALQFAQAGPAPILLRVDTKAGHGAGKPTTKIIETIADEWAFLVNALGMRPASEPRADATAAPEPEAPPEPAPAPAREARPRRRRPS